MKKIFVSIVLLAFAECNKSSKIKYLESDPQLQLYNDVLDELVTHHFYGGYLGEEALEALYRKYVYNRQSFDSVAYYAELETLRKSVESDTAKQKSISLRNDFGFGLKEYLKYYISDSTTTSNGLNDFISVVSSDFLSAYDILDTPQKKYAAKSFHASAFKIVPFTTYNDSQIGVVSFSNLIVNKAGDKALLYYEFWCGGKCGKGEILLLVNEDSAWKIKREFQTWIS